MHCVQCYCEPVSLISLSKFELAPTPDEFVINCCPRKAEEFFYCVFSDEILWLTDVSVFFRLLLPSGSKKVVVARCLGK